GRRARAHAAGARREEPVGVGRRADASRHLQLRGAGRLGEAANEVLPDPPAADPIEVDDVDLPRSRGGEPAHELLRPRAHRHALEVTLLEPDGFSTQQIDRGKNSEPLFCHVSMLIQHSSRAGEITAVAEGSHPEWETKEARDLLKTIVSLRTVDEAERFLR